MREEDKKGEQRQEEFYRMYFHLSEKNYRVNCARLLLDRALISHPFER
jgi:hypothetical protein